LAKIPAHLAAARHTMIAAGVNRNGVPHHVSLRDLIGSSAGTGNCGTIK